jgi:hypothetical protein
MMSDSHHPVDEHETTTPRNDGWTKRLWLYVRRIVPVAMMRHQDTDDTNRLLLEEAIQTLLATSSDCQNRNKESHDNFNGFLSNNKIIHVRQQETWDCGIACLEMALRWLSIPENHDVVDRSDMLKLAATQSIWTIDLVWILHHVQNRVPHYSFRYLFCSQRFEASDEWSNMKYYQDAFPTDQARVSRRFREARLMVPMLEIALSIAQLIQLIREPHCIAIALVDMTMLRGNTAVCSDSLPIPNNDTPKSSSYIGHYVLVSGVCRDPEAVHHARRNCAQSSSSLSSSESWNDSENEEVLIVLDPGVDQSISYYTVSHFEMAWKAQGTDQDVIFIVKNVQ